MYFIHITLAEAFESWVSSKQDEYKDIFKEEKKEAMREVTKAKNEMWDRTYSRINCKLGFKGLREVWLILKNMRKQTRYKTKKISL
jgi:hypothetical protein